MAVSGFAATATFACSPASEHRRARSCAIFAESLKTALILQFQQLPCPAPSAPLGKKTRIRNRTAPHSPMFLAQLIADARSSASVHTSDAIVLPPASPSCPDQLPLHAPDHCWQQQ